MYVKLFVNTQPWFAEIDWETRKLLGILGKISGQIQLRMEDGSKRGMPLPGIVDSGIIYKNHQGKLLFINSKVDTSLFCRFNLPRDLVNDLQIAPQSLLTTKNVIIVLFFLSQPIQVYAFPLSPEDQIIVAGNHN